MEYYDHNIGREESHRRDPGYRDERDQYGSYRTTYREGPRDVRPYREFRNDHYRGRGNPYYRYNRRGGYHRGDNDYRDEIDTRTSRGRVPRHYGDNKYFNGERSPYSASKEVEQARYLDKNSPDDSTGSSRKAPKENKKSRYHSSHYEESDGSISDEMDLDKELNPISHYLDIDDREEMLIQVFKVIKGPKLRAMLTSVLKDIDLTELKLLCLEQLEGMSKTRIRAILAGEEMEDSSATEDDEDIKPESGNESANKDQTEDMAGEQNRNSTSPRQEIVKAEAKTKNGEKSKRKHLDKHVLGNFTGVIQFKSGGRPSDKNKDGALVISSDSSDEDLEMVIATGNEERKRKHDLKEKITKTKKIGFKVGRKGKASTTAEKSLQGDTEEKDTTTSDNVDKSGKTLMELLELEMRARAIKALLGNKENGTTTSDNAKSEVVNNELKVVAEDENCTNNEHDKEDNGDLSKEMEEEKRLQKAREQLHISEAKKREEEEATERNHAEIRKRLEEQQRMKEMDELEAKQKEQEELEKAKKTQKKQEEYEKFLLWKQERQRKKEEKQKIELKRQEEDEWYTRQAVKQKERQMKETEIEQAKEKMRIDRMTEMKRSKINRINVAEDYSDEEFDTEENEDVNVTDRKLPSANSISSSHGNEPEKQKLNDRSEKRVKTRRYRRKNPDEEGQLPSDESEFASDLGDELDHDSFSDGKVSSGSETSLSNSEGSEKDDEEMDNRRIETIRRRRAEIRKRNRRRKPAADIEEGEVDSDGEHFEPMEESRDPKIRMILHHLPKRKRVKKVIRTDETESQNLDQDSSNQCMEEKNNIEHVGESSNGDKEPQNEQSILENNEVKAKLIDEEAQMNISGKSSVTDHTGNKIDDNSSMNIDLSDEKISDVGNCDKKDMDFDSEKIAPIEKPPVELKATNSQKIEIDKPTSNPILLEARRAFLSSKPKEENQKIVHPLRSSDSEGPSDNDNSLIETFEERAERKRKDKEERKRKKKVEEQKAKRFKRMQAFQARSGMQNFMDVDQPDSNDTEIIEEDGKNIANPSSSIEKDGISEKSVNEEPEITDDQPLASFGNGDQSESISKQSKDDIVKDSINIKGDVKNKRKRKGREKKKSPEEAQMEGVGFWARMCESQGDFEVPNVSEEPTLPETASLKDEKTMVENKTSYNPITTRKTRSVKYFPCRASMSKGRKLNVDKPNKEQVDKQQEEMDNITWEDRWYQNKNVQKVMKHSQLMSKVRSNIKIKLKDPDGLAEQISIPESSGEINAGKISSNSSSEISTPDITQNEQIDSGSVPKQITGSMEDYANIVGKTAQDLEKEQLEDLDKESDIDESDEDEGKDDDLWGAIMGAKS